MTSNNPGSRMTAAGFAVLLLAVSAGVGSDEYGELLGLVGALVGANLVVLGLRTMAHEEPTTPFGPAAFAGVCALRTWLCRNLPVVGLAMASCTITAVASEVCGPMLCFSIFGLFLLGISLITTGIRGE